MSTTPWYLQDSLGQRVVGEVQTYLRSEACKKAHKYKVGEGTASDLIAEHPFPPDPRRSQSHFDFPWHIVDSVVAHIRKELKNDLQEAEKDVLRDLVNFTGRWVDFLPDDNRSSLFKRQPDDYFISHPPFTRSFRSHDPSNR